MMLCVTARIRSLGEQMAERRDELGISQAAAARTAKVSRTTWVNWEADAAIPEGYNRKKIDRVLRWEPGSAAEAISSRRPAVPLPDKPDDDDDLPAVSEGASVVAELMRGLNDDQIRELLTLGAAIVATRRRRQRRERELSTAERDASHVDREMPTRSR